MNIKRSNDLISVIIPVYNAEKYLASCIMSVLQQTYKNLQIILINDGSTDLSGKICDEYAMKDERIHVIHTTNGGVSRARNLGLDYANGDYLSFVDSDDTINEQMIETLHRDLVNNNCDISICGFVFVRPEKSYRSYKEDVLLVHDAKEALCNVLIGKYYAGHLCNKLFKLSVIKQTRLDEQIYIYEDLLFICQVLLECENVVFHSIPLYNYYIREGSAFYKKMDDKYYTSHLACLKIVDLLEDNTDTFYHAYASVLICNIGMLERLYYDKSGRKSYCHIIKNNIRKYFNSTSLKYMNKLRRCYVFAAYVSPYVFFCLRWIVIKARKVKGNKNYD